MRAPSGCNLQPWHVWLLTGEARDRFVALALADFDANPAGDQPDYEVHPAVLNDTYQSRYAAAGNMMYNAAGIARDNDGDRLRHRRRNCEFFGAPAGLMFTIDRNMGPGKWADVGMFMQTIMLVARDFGLDTCAQESWAMRSRLIRAFLGVPDSQVVHCGMAIGYADESAPINNFRSERDTLENLVTILR